MKQSDLVTIFETQTYRNNWAFYTGNYRARILCDDGESICWSIPGKGGRVSQRSARRILELWKQGFSAGEISNVTGFELV
jgi:hypothetical protein